MDVRAAVTMMRGGSLRDRVAAIRAGRAGTRLALVGSALHAGLLDELAAGPRTTGEVCERLGFEDRIVTEGWLQVLRTAGQVRATSAGWRLTRRGRATVGDDMVRATYEAFSDYHTGLYRELPAQLRGGPGRRDVADKGELIARLSRVMDPFVTGVVRSAVTQRSAGNVLDVGCGAGLQLAAMLEAAPRASGTGVDVDPAAAGLARATLRERGLDDRAEVLVGDVRELAVTGRLPGSLDLALLANVVYYVPRDRRLDLFGTLAERLAAGGALLVVTTALTDDEFSRHFDLLLRAQEGGAMELPALDGLAEQLRAAGLRPGRPRRIAPGEPLYALLAERA
jgi:SAM-dependent methyltransferase